MQDTRTSTGSWRFTREKYRPGPQYLGADKKVGVSSGKPSAVVGLKRPAGVSACCADARWDVAGCVSGSGEDASLKGVPALKVAQDQDATLAFI